MRSLSVSAPKVGRSVEFERDFGGETAASTTATYGEKVFKTLFDEMATIKCAGVMRSALQARKEDGNFKYTDEQVISIGMAYVPQVGAERKPKDIFAGIIAKIQSGTPKKEVIRELEERITLLKSQEG